MESGARPGGPMAKKVPTPKNLLTQDIVLFVLFCLFKLPPTSKDCTVRLKRSVANLDERTDAAKNWIAGLQHRTKAGMIQWDVLIHNIQNFFQKHQTSWISASKLAIDPRSWICTLRRVRIGVQIQNEGSMASFDVLIQLVWSFLQKVLDVMN